MMQKQEEPEILLEDRDLIAVRKPAGLAVQSRALAGMDLEHEIRNKLAEESDAGSAEGLSVINRLDQPVEGIVLFARNKKTAAALSRQLQNHEMQKEYLAVLDTEFVPEGEHILQDYLLKNAGKNCSEVVPEGTEGAKAAELSYVLLEQQAGKALVRINLYTGRHHQIRVQLAHAGMPVSGDRKYGDHSGEQKFPALCAFRLTFRHPVSGELICVKTKPAGEEFLKFEDLYCRL